ncbi:hypothetical protein [Carboxylicivirga taeanensis]|uniref:hypothetical protein n=1 Tax=Carboxylicivirga taeanensis TaxID=1416875 RepID=UPI003F6E080B
MAKKVIFKVHGHGELNGNYKIDIEKEMDSELAYKLRSKNNLIQFVKQECPGIKIKENSLGYKINPLVDTNVVNAKKANEKKKKSKSQMSSSKTISLKNINKKKIIGGAIAAAVIVPIVKEVVENVIDEVKEVINKSKN